MISSIKKTIRKISHLFQKETINELNSLRSYLDYVSKRTSEIEIDNYLLNHLYHNEKYLGNKRLNRFEYQVFSQYGEDGIINEIFRRLQVYNGFFVEFGVENGLECNTTNLLLKNWRGLWIEGSDTFYNAVQKIFSKDIGCQRLKVSNNYVTPDNIELILKESYVPEDFDLLSIDIDFNDYYVWDAIVSYRPKVVVIEYNATFRPDTEYVVKYKDNGNGGDFSSHFGASLYSYELLGQKKGYSLVACSFSGVNAFFIRNDLLNDNFEFPYTAANHYEPCRYFLYTKHGHRRNWGERLDVNIKSPVL